MRGLLPLVAAAIITGCADSVEILTTPPPPPVPPAPTFKLDGLVLDGDGARLPDALVEVVEVHRHMFSDDTGYYSFSGLSGSVGLRVQKEDFETRYREVHMLADTRVDVALSRIIRSDTLILGGKVWMTVEGTSSPCDPVHWDARAPCKRIFFTPRTTGILSLRITWQGPPVIDATVVTTNDQYLATSRDGVGDEVLLDVAVTAGGSYVIRVNTYYGQQVFAIESELIVP